MIHRRRRTQEQFLCFLTVGIHIVSSLRPVLKGKPLWGGYVPLARNLRTVFANLYFLSKWQFPFIFGCLWHNSLISILFYQLHEICFIKICIFTVTYGLWKLISASIYFTAVSKYFWLCFCVIFHKIMASHVFPLLWVRQISFCNLLYCAVLSFPFSRLLNRCNFSSVTNNLRSLLLCSKQRTKSRKRSLVPCRASPKPFR